MSTALKNSDKQVSAIQFEWRNLTKKVPYYLTSCQLTNLIEMKFHKLILKINRRHAQYLKAEHPIHATHYMPFMLYMLHMLYPVELYMLYMLYPIHAIYAKYVIYDIHAIHAMCYVVICKPKIAVEIFILHVLKYHHEALSIVTYSIK